MAYPGEHTDVAAHLQAHGWEATTSRLNDLFVAAGVPQLAGADQQSQAASLTFVRAFGLNEQAGTHEERLANQSACITSSAMTSCCGMSGSSSR